MRARLRYYFVPRPGIMVEYMVGEYEARVCGTKSHAGSELKRQPQRRTNWYYYSIGYWCFQTMDRITMGCCTPTFDPMLSRSAADGTQQEMLYVASPLLGVPRSDNMTETRENIR